MSYIQKEMMRKIIHHVTLYKIDYVSDQKAIECEEKMILFDYLRYMIGKR